MIEVLHHLIRRCFQLDKIHEQANVVQFPATRIDLDAIVVAVQIFKVRCFETPTSVATYEVE